MYYGLMKIRGAALAGDFAKRRWRRGRRRDPNTGMPAELRQELADMGLYGITIPPEHGRSGWGHRVEPVVEEVSKWCRRHGRAPERRTVPLRRPIVLSARGPQKANVPAPAGERCGHRLPCLTEPGSGGDAGAGAAWRSKSGRLARPTGTKIFDTNARRGPA